MISLGFIVTLLVSHFGGSALGGLLVKHRLFGFGPKLTISKHVLGIGRALHAAYKADESTKSKAALKRWLKSHDPDNESKIGDGI